MSDKMNIDELKAMIASEIKNIGLHSVLGSDAVESIKNKVMKVYKHEKAVNEMPEIIPESNTPEMLGAIENVELSGTNTNVKVPINNFDSTIQPGQNIDAGTTGNIPAYTPELPEFMNSIEPGKVIIFSQNELSEGGENLSNKPLRTFSNPDEKKSMHDLWMENGKRKAEVYMVKLEKIGDLEFNYANGTTQFIEKRFDPNFEAQAKYKENPYMADNAGPAAPGTLDMNGQPHIMNQIATSVDLEKVVSDLVLKLLKDKLMTNTTQAVNADEFNSDTMLPKQSSGVPMYPTGAINPGTVSEVFSLKMVNLIDDFNKVDTPERLKEAIEKNDKNFLINENEEVQEWQIEGNSYFTPVNKISTRKCYIKN